MINLLNFIEQADGRKPVWLLVKTTVTGCNLNKTNVVWGIEIFDSWQVSDGSKMRAQLSISYFFEGTRGTMVEDDSKMPSEREWILCMTKVIRLLTWTAYIFNFILIKSLLSIPNRKVYTGRG